MSVVRVFIGADVRVEGDGLDGNAVRALIAAHPRGAVAGAGFVRLGRAAAGAVLRAFPGAVVTDSRTDAPYAAAGSLAAKYPPGAERYDPAAVAAGGGGVLLLTANTWRRGVPNIVRNIAVACGQQAQIICANVAAMEAACNGLFDDWRAYSSVAAVPDGAHGLVVVVADDTVDAVAALVDRPEVLRARVLVLVAPPSEEWRRFAEAHADVIGPVVYSNARSDAVALLPVATPFDGACRRCESKNRELDVKSTLFAMADDRQRNDVIAATIMRTAGDRNLFICQYISAANALLGAVSHLQPYVLIPTYAQTGIERAGQIKALRNSAAADHLFITADDAAELADVLPDYDRAFIIQPVTATAAVAATAAIRRRSRVDGTGKKMIVDFVDVRITELAARADARRNALEKASPVLAEPMDERYVK